MKIVVIGSINMDFVLQVTALPQKGETLLAQSYTTIPGGKGANQAVAAARLGAEVAMIGALGRDSIGDKLLEKLQQENIQISGVKRTETTSGNALITVDANGDNTIIVYPGANFDVTKEWLLKNAAIIGKADWVMFQLEIPLESVVTGVKLVKQQGGKVLLNPAPAKQLPEALYPMLDLITPNETELSLLANIKGIESGAAVLLEKGVGTVVVTLGKKGSLALTKKGVVQGKPFVVKAVDTTAAGDAFNAALVVALQEQKPLEDALAFANATGAITSTAMGAQDSLPSRQQVEEFIIQQG